LRSGKTDEWIFVDFIGEMAVILKNERERV